VCFYERRRYSSQPGADPAVSRGLNETMNEEHLQAGRVWVLVRDAIKLELSEEQHVSKCPACHEWLTGFTTLARNAGFTVRLEIPPLRSEALSKGA